LLPIYAKFQDNLNLYQFNFSRSSILVPIESAHATSYLLVISSNCTVWQKDRPTGDSI